nr:hypothetical protein [Streptomyces sp. SM11]
MREHLQDRLHLRSPDFERGVQLATRAEVPALQLRRGPGGGPRAGLVGTGTRHVGTLPQLPVDPECLVADRAQFVPVHHEVAIGAGRRNTGLGPSGVEAHLRRLPVSRVGLSAAHSSSNVMGPPPLIEVNGSL